MNTKTLYVLPALLCIGCSYIPHRTIFITDTRGRPIPSARVDPYPILLRDLLTGTTSNSADSRGRIKLYDLIHGGDYTLNARGFSKRQIAFPQHNNGSYALKPAN